MQLEISGRNPYFLGGFKGEKPSYGGFHDTASIVHTLLAIGLKSKHSARVILLHRLLYCEHVM